MREFRKKFLVLFLAVIMIFTFTACGNNTDEDSSNESADTGTDKTIVYAQTGAWNRIMPYDLVGLMSINPNEKIFDRLCGFDNENIIYYRAAESIDVSEDKLVFTVHLREDSLWHDGEPVTAYDWEWTFKTMAQPQFEGYGSRGYLSVFEGTDSSGTGDIQIKALDDYTLEMHLKKPNTPEAFFGTYSYYYYVLPKHCLENYSLDELGTCEFWDNPIGSGPCKFVSETPGYEVVVVPFEDYYLGCPEFDQLIYRVYDAGTLSSAFLAGEIDIAWNTVSADEALNTLDGQNGLHAVKVDNVKNLQMSFNHEVFPKEVRHAFELAIDKQLCVDSVLKGYGEVCSTYVQPGTKYYNTDISTERDVDAAKALLEKAEGFDFDRTYTLGCGTPDYEKIGAIIQQNMAELGIKIEIVTGDPATMLSGARDGSIDMTFVQSTSAANPTYFMKEFDADSVNYGRITDQKWYNKHVEVNISSSEEERIQRAWELQEMLYEDSPYVNIYDQYLYMVCSAKLDNITVPNNDKCWEWKVG